MVQNEQMAPATATLSPESHQPAHVPSAQSTTQLPPELEKAQKLLDAGRAEEALKVVIGRSSGGPLAVNARAVCLMRLNQPAEAVKALRTIALESGGLLLKRNTSLAVKTNFATALALSGNVSGASRILGEIEEKNDKHVQALRQAIERWQKNLSTWEWLQWKTGIAIERAVQLDFPPGTLI
ncbi:hypothetical protein AB1L42_01065 [Thalassoglobus sp. JC818]|uniref:hypothetical protein n=1 Tax=Thalassoglobus sp. JC818 TaxID=3232136 RepID=UPI003457B372